MLIIIVVASLIFLQNPSEPETLTPVVTPTQSLNTFNIVSVYPTEDLANKISPLVSVKITFSEPLNKGTFFYKVSPEITTEVSSTDTEVTITPKTSWPMDQEIIITITSVQSNSGVSLSAPYIIKMRVPIPEGE